MNLASDAVTEVEKCLKSKQLWLDWAEIFDSWRVVPRTVLLGLFHMTVSLDTTVVYWFIHLPHPTGSDVTALTGSVTVISALFGAALKFYIDNGRKWTSGPGVQ